jgi:hypothetical protein
VILVSIIVAGILLFDLEQSKSEENKLYTYPISVAEKIYVVIVRTNWTSAPEVYLPEVASNYVSVDFGGSLRAAVFFNITLPTDLIWGRNVSSVEVL